MLNGTPAIDAAALRDLAKERRMIVEIGTFTGGTAEILAEAMAPDGHLVTIDPYLTRPAVHWGQADGQIQEVFFTCGEALLQAVNRLERFRNRVTQIMGESVKVARMFADQSLDLVFIDGAHDYESVMADLRAWLPKVKPDGIISGHDFNVQACIVKDEYAEEKMMLNSDPVTGIHFGVYRALEDTFETYQRASAEINCSVWWTTPDTAKGVEDVSEAVER